MDTIFGVETRTIDEVEAAANDVARGEGGAVRLARARAAEAVAVVAVVAVALLVPARQPVHVDPLGGQTHAHVAVPPLGDYLHLEVVESARGRDGLRGPHRARIFMCFAVSFVVNSQIGLR